MRARFGLGAGEAATSGTDLSCRVSAARALGKRLHPDLIGKRPTAAISSAARLIGAPPRC
jgi:hypothetical protein